MFNPSNTSQIDDDECDEWLMKHSRRNISCSDEWTLAQYCTIIYIHTYVAKFWCIVSIRIIRLAVFFIFRVSVILINISSSPGVSFVSFGPLHISYLPGFLSKNNGVNAMAQQLKQECKWNYVCVYNNPASLVRSLNFSQLKWVNVDVSFNFIVEM